MVPPATKWDRPDGANRRAGSSDQLRQLSRSAMKSKHTSSALLQPAGKESCVDFAPVLHEQAMNSTVRSSRRIPARGLPCEGGQRSVNARIPIDARVARTMVPGCVALSGHGVAAAGGDQ